MHILISNDDGYQARGIHVLTEQLKAFAQVTVIAPEQDRSGASNSLTLTSPIRAREHGNGIISVDGTPTDCVHLGITGLLEEEPDLVVSGINAGANMGDDVLYSGTVAAATEGRFLGSSAIAVSLAGIKLRHYETAAKIVSKMIENMDDNFIPSDTILNVNVPDLPLEEISGVQVTRLGNRHKAEPVIKSHDPRGLPIYWVGPPGQEQDCGEGTDFHAVRNGYVSVTPLHVDLTRHDVMKRVGNWLKGFEI